MSLLRSVLLGLIIGTVAVGFIVPAAEMPPTALAKPQLVEISGTPIFDQTGELESIHFTAKFRIVGFRPDGRTLTYHIESVNFNLPQENGKSVVLGNSIVNLRDVGTDLVDLARYVWEEKHPPQPRQRVREPGTAK